MGVAAGGDKTGGRLAQCESATWSCAVVRTDTDSNGQVRTINLLEYCDKPYHHKPRKRRYTHPTTRLSGNSRTTGALPQPPSGGINHYLTPVGRQPNDRRKSQRARGDIAPLFASFVKAAARAWTHVLNRADVRRQGSREQARTPR